MQTVLIQTEADEADSPRSWELVPGQEVTFGRGAPDVAVDVEIADPAVSRLAGRIRAVDTYWVLTNLSGTHTYVVENPEGGGEFVKVAPGRVDAPIPFEFARVVLPGGREPVSFLVFAAVHNYLDPVSLSSGAGTSLAFPLDPTAKYFLVLVALCEPRLRDPSSQVIPTVSQIIDRLGDSGLTPSAVAFHIKYLATAKLRVRQDGEGGRADWQRAALISLALRFDLVREEHLALLPRL
ncbi:FHA domain-containing protein [Sphaerisporangium rufum]|nr:FHA domain-containing protein [Sphaerisporangium rufum]